MTKLRFYIIKEIILEENMRTWTSALTKASTLAWSKIRIRARERRSELQPEPELRPESEQRSEPKLQP